MLSCLRSTIIARHAQLPWGKDGSVAFALVCILCLTICFCSSCVECSYLSHCSSNQKMKSNVSRKFLWAICSLTKQDQMKSLMQGKCIQCSVRTWWLRWGAEVSKRVTKHGNSATSNPFTSLPPTPESDVKHIRALVSRKGKFEHFVIEYSL